MNMKFNAGFCYENSLICLADKISNAVFKKAFFLFDITVHFNMGQMKQKSITLCINYRVK